MKNKLKTNKIIKIFFKIFISLAIVLVIINKVDLSKIFLYLKSMDIWLYALGLFLLTIGMFISTYKWFLLLKNLKIKTNFLNLLKYYYIGSFFNMFMPSAIGGDTVRIAIFGKTQNKTAEVGISVFMERLLGLLALLAIAIIVFIGNISHFKNMAFIYLFAFLAIIEGLIITFLIKPKMAKPIFVVVIRFFMLLRFSKIKKVIIKLYKAILKIHRNSSRVMIAILLSFVFQLLSVLISITVASGLSLNIPTSYFFIFVPIIAIAVMLPLSFNGVGIREMAAIFLYGQLGIASEKVITLTLVIFSYLIINSIVGGIVFIFNKQSKKRITAY